MNTTPVQVKCTQCENIISLNRQNLSLNLWGKRITVACKKCNNNMTFLVNAELMSGKSVPSVSDKTDTLKTELLTPKEGNKKILKIQVLNTLNDQIEIHPLQEGKNILGRPSVDDVNTHGKINILNGDTTVSRVHCEIDVIRQKDGSYSHILSDPKSKNGTHLILDNGHKTLDKYDKIVVKHSSIIGLGNRTKIKLI